VIKRYKIIGSSRRQQLC